MRSITTWLRGRYAPTVTIAALLMSANAVAAEEERPLVLDGYCSVSIVDAKKWVVGESAITTEFDGREYRFATEERREKFLQRPEQYAPAFGGDCIVTYSKTGERVRGQLAYGVFSDGRLFLFASAGDRERFRATPARYADADLAYGGRSPVRLVDDGDSVRGEESFVSVHRGIRYYFATSTERETFLADPTKYEVERKKDEVAGQEALVSVSGKSACAYCDYRVWPMLTKGELGLAIVAGDGKIYVVERADTLYPKLYNDRFDGIRMSVTGREIRRRGRFVWVVPEALEAE